MSTTTPTMTPKQRQVFELLAKGTQASEIAKRLKISTSGVYGHMRNMRAAGVQLPGDPVNGDAPTGEFTPPSAAPTDETVVSASDPEATLRDAIARRDERMREIDTECASLQERITQRQAERATLEAQGAKYKAALDALA